MDIANAGDSRIFVVEQGGTIQVFQSDGTALGTFLDIDARVISGGERGLLGLAFHPNYASNGFFYVNYTRDPDDSMSDEPGEGDTRISRFSRIGGPGSNSADPASELIILDIPQPFSNHNAGDLNFGPDGNLWIAMGDGGSGGDPNDAGQDPDTLLGKMVRIDVDGGSPYAIPADNPFIGPDGILDEIWAFGFRNPFRFGFDRTTDDLWIADVGQGAWEEVDFEPVGTPGGRNYGWRCHEGPDPFNLSGCGPTSSYTFPVHAYDHSGGRCSITGGFVYRGAPLASLIGGHYFFADFCSGDMYSLSPGSCPGTFDLNVFGGVVSSPSSFGESASGDLFIASLGGTVSRIQATGTPLTPDPCLTCAATPLTSCRQPGVTKAVLVEKNNPDDNSKDKLIWKWLKGEVTPVSAFGDPDPARYVLCLYSGTAQSELLEAGIPSQAECPTCWSSTGTGFKFKDDPPGVTKMVLKSSLDPGKSKIVLKMKGVALPAIPLEQPILVQLSNADGECWEASYSDPPIKNEGTTFKDKSD